MTTASPYTLRPPVRPDERDESFEAQLSLLPATLEDAFNKFHAENPGVYRLLLQYAHQVKAAGWEHYSVDALFHRIRWHYSVETREAEGFKLNDHYTSYYARLLNHEPGLEGFFRTRELRRAS